MDKGNVAATVNALAGWTELLDENVANGLYIAYRVADGTEGATTTFTLSGATRGAWIVYEISGAENPATQAPQIGTTSTGTSTTPDPPASATPPSAKDYLFIAFAGMAGEEADDDTWGNTPPTNYTPSPPRQKSCGIAGANLGGLILSAERQLNTGVATNPGAFGVDVSAAWRAQTIMIHPSFPAVLDQKAFRFRNDDGSEAAATWKDAQNTDISLAETDPFRLRFEIQETAGGVADTVQSRQFKLQRSLNGGSWFDVDGSSAVVKARLSSHFVDDDPTTDQLTAGTGTFQAGTIKEINGSTTIAAIGANVHTEIEFSLEFVPADVVDTDTIDFRLIYLAGAVIGAYTEIPRVTISSASGPIEVTLVPATETNTPQTLTLNTLVTLGIKTETSAPQAILLDKKVILGTVAESNVLVSLVKIKRKTLGIVSETNSPQALVRVTRVTLGTATETNTPQALVRVTRVTLGIVAETNALLGLSLDTLVSLGVVAETNTPIALVIGADGEPILVTLTAVTEANTAVGLALDKLITLGFAAETSSEHGLIIVKRKTWIPIAESNAVQTLNLDTRVTLAPATETNVAQALSRGKRIILIPAIEANTAQAITTKKQVILAFVDETNTVIRLTIEGGAEPIVVAVPRNWSLSRPGWY
jgi:hypothetical protein